MDSYVRHFVRASLIWLGVGVLIGISMAFWPREALVWRTLGRRRAGSSSTPAHPPLQRAAG